MEKSFILEEFGKRKQQETAKYWILTEKVRAMFWFAFYTNNEAVSRRWQKNARNKIYCYLSHMHKSPRLNTQTLNLGWISYYKLIILKF